jgi:hypothetical protein
MNAKDTIQNYLNEMLKWEQDFYKTQRSSEFRGGDANYRKQQQAMAKVELDKIISKYLTTDAYEVMGKSTLITMAVSNPPMYDQIVTEADEKIKTATVISKSNNNTSMPIICKFTLTMEETHWKIKALHHANPYNPNWKKAGAL